VVQCRKAVALAYLFHVAQLLVLELQFVDISPVNRGWVQRKARSEGTVCSNHDIVLARPAIPVSKTEIAVAIFFYSRRFSCKPFKFAIGAGSISIPTDTSQVMPG